MGDFRLTEQEWSELIEDVDTKDCVTLGRILAHERDQRNHIKVLEKKLAALLETIEHYGTGAGLRVTAFEKASGDLKD